MRNFKAMASFQRVHLLSLLVLATVPWTLADDGGAFFNTPTTSSTYARVQYANQANLTRRFGSSRDPTIQYISFDELYNKYNKGGSKAAPVFTTAQEAMTTSEGPGAADDKMDSHWPEDSPNLRNGWTVERQQPEVKPEAGPSKTRTKAPASAFNKGIDQVYAYSNAYQSGQFAKEAAPKAAPGEYAHAIEEDHVGAGSDLKVMETSWTDMDQEGEEERPTTAAVHHRSDNSAATSTSARPRSKPDGVQSDWRPFAGPSTPPTTATPKAKRLQKTTRPSVSNNGSEDDVLFYSEAQQAASRRPEVPPTHPQGSFLVRPTNTEPGQLWLMPNAADNEVTRGPRPFSSRPDERVQFGQPPFMHSNQHPIVLPPPMDNRFQQGPPPQQGPNDRFQQGPPPQQGPNDRFQQGPPPQQGPNDRFQQGPPPQQGPNDRFQQGPPQQGPNDHRFQQGPPPQQGPPQWTSVNPNFPLSRPSGPPSGPVGVSPQLLNPSGQVRPRPQEPERRPIQIPLPVPRPSGPLGSSPDNPLPGPPIALPGIPAFNVHGNGRPNEAQRFSPGPPQHFPDRIDGPQGPPDNFIRGPPQNFNPNGQQPQFNGQRPNFSRPPPPPAPTSTSIIKSFFSRFFPFARSLDLDGVPIVDVDQLTNNGTNLTVLANAPPEVLAHLLKMSSNTTGADLDDDELTTAANSTSNTTELSF